MIHKAQITYPTCTRKKFKACTLWAKTLRFADDKAVAETSKFRQTTSTVTKHQHIKKLFALLGSRQKE